MDSQTKNQLVELYLSPESSGSYGGVNRLFRAAKKAGLKVTRSQVEEWLESSPLYTKHVNKPERHPRAHVLSNGLNDVLQMDLMKGPYPGSNFQTEWLLVVVDCFSLFIHAVGLRSKKSKLVSKALESILNQLPTAPNLILSDQGGKKKMCLKNSKNTL